MLTMSTRAMQSPARGACGGHKSFLAGLMMLIWVCAFNLLTSPTAHAQSLGPISGGSDIIVDENPIGDIDDFLHLIPGDVTDGPSRKLLHGCHKKRCLKGCPKCTFSNKTSTKGHCKKKGKLHNCKKTSKTSPKK